MSVRSMLLVSKLLETVAILALIYVIWRIV